VSLPPPVASLPEWSSRAETLAHAYMEEGRAALWIAAREVVRDLDYEPDPRGIATGDSVRLGLYNKGGLVGLASATKTHSSICKLLNLLVVAIRSEHRWTSLSINRNCRTDVHKDQGNADEEHLPSMLIGLCTMQTASCGCSTRMAQFTLRMLLRECSEVQYIPQVLRHSCFTGSASTTLPCPGRRVIVS